MVGREIRFASFDPDGIHIDHASPDLYFTTTVRNAEYYRHPLTDIMVKAPLNTTLMKSL
ncbi:MAG: hypothetical protein JW730_12265 [Anaerolineales bacterium]|nr:hypothetical protein [Anaerolineales bacterium]